MSTERKEKLDSIGFVFLGIRKRKAARISNDDDDGSGGDHDQDDTSNDQDEHDVTTAARISNDDHDGSGGDHDQDDTSNDQDEHDVTTAARISIDDDDGSGGDHDQDDTSNDQDEHDVTTAARISIDDDDGSGGDHDQDDTSNDQDEHDNSSCWEATPETVIGQIEEFIIRSVLEPLERGDTPQVDEPKRSFSHSMHCRSLTSLFMVADFCHDLLKSGRTTTIREVYYFYVTFFRNQQESDNAIRDLASCLSVSRSALGLVASPRGWFCGCIDLYCQRDNSDNNGEMEGGQELVPILNGRELDSHGMAITLQLKTQIVRSPDAKCILVIEKEGIYHRLSEDKFFLKYYPCILVTGKGVPDLATKSWVQHLQQSLKLPVYGLCDCNPYGISVLQTFQYQGLARSHRAGTNNNNNNTRNRRQFDLKWMGLRPSQVEELDLPARVYQELTDHDKKRLDSLKAGTNPFCQMGNAERRIQELDKFEFKVELEALYWKGFGFLSQWVHSNLMLHEKEVQEQQPSNPESHSQYII